MQTDEPSKIAGNIQGVGQIREPISGTLKSITSPSTRYFEEHHTFSILRMVSRCNPNVRAAFRMQGGNHHSKRSAFSPALIRVADTSPSPGWRSVRMSSSQLRSFT